jgi:hypothetical protein
VKNKLFKTQIQRTALLMLPYPLIVTLMSIDRLLDSNQSLSLSFCFYLVATLVAGVLTFTDLGKRIESRLQLRKRKFD